MLLIFDSVKSELYPRACHGLCLYHLVTQKLQDLGRKKFLDLIIKKILTWFTLSNCGYSHGCNLEELRARLSLTPPWLCYQVGCLYAIRQKSDSSHSMKHNAAELEDWLIHKLVLLYHKEHWLFPLRVAEGLMTLVSSSVEGVNHTMKHKSSKTVTPNMTMCTSFETQETQVHTRMLKWKRMENNAGMPEHSFMG